MMSAVVRMADALICPVTEIEVAETLLTDILPGTEMLDADKFETNIDVLLIRLMFAVKEVFKLL